MVMRIICLTSILTLSCGSISTAHEMKFYDNKENGDICLLDAVNLKNDTGTITCILKDDLTNQGAASIIMEVKADCTKKTLKIIKSTYKDAKDVIVKIETEESELPIFGRNYDVAFRMICM